MAKYGILLICLLACTTKKETTIYEPITYKKLLGVYTGVTPCADCEGIYTRIEFIDSITFIKSSKYLGKSSRAFLDMGQWKIKNDSIIELIAHGNSNQYLHEGIHLTMLDVEGKRIKGALAAYYKLSKGEPEHTANRNTNTLEEIDFVAHGNEPSWNLELDFDKFVRFTTLEGDSIHAALPAPTVDGIHTSYSISTSDATLSFKLSPTGCVESMSGAYSNYAVEITYNQKNIFHGCGDFVNSIYQLTGDWALTSILNQPIKESDYATGLPTLHFNVIEKNVSGFTGCNRLNGNFEVNKQGMLKFLPLATTRMFCEGKGETSFLQAMDQVEQFRIEGDKLMLSSKDRDLLSFSVN